MNYSLTIYGESNGWRYSKNYKATIRTGDTAELYVCEGKGSGSERGEWGAEEMEWGNYYLANVFEEWPGETLEWDLPALAVHFNHW